MYAAEPGVDAVLVAREVVLCRLHADVDGTGVVDDVSNMSGHVYRAGGASVVLSGRGGRRGERGREREGGMGDKKQGLAFHSA